MSSLVFLPAALCWRAKIIIIIISLTSQSSLVSLHPHPPTPIQKTALFAFVLFSLSNFSSIIPVGSADPICPYVGRPWVFGKGMLRYGSFTPYRRVASVSIGAWPRRLGAQASCDWLIAICAQPITREMRGLFAGNSGMINVSSLPGICSVRRLGHVHTG